MAGTNRPLSPHLQIYQRQITSVLSITHQDVALRSQMDANLMGAASLQSDIE